MPKNPKHPDYFLLAITGILIILGIIILASVSASVSQEKFGTTYYYLNHQLLFGLLPGLILGFLAFRINLSFLRKIAPFLLLLNLLFLAMVFLPKIGASSGGAARWISFGPVSFQPSEFLKLTFILYLASWLTSQKEKIKLQKTAFNATFGAFLIVIILISLFLIFQPDISTLVVIIASAVILYFLIKTPLWHSILIILIGAGGLFSLIKLAPYRLNRILVFLKPELDPMGIGYQLKQSLITVGSGGLFGLGLGLGLSRQRFNFLPQSISDSVFAVFAEETGFIGALILIVVFLLFLWQTFKIAKINKDSFSQLTVLGISSWIAIQGFINIGAMIGILPLTGIPLPFISYGGSHIVAELVGMGIILNISKNSG